MCDHGYRESHCASGKVPTPGRVGDLKCPARERASSNLLGWRECRRHLDLAIHPLLAQDGHPWPGAPGHEGRGHVVRGVEGEDRREAGVARVADPVVLLPGGLGVVPERLHLPGGLGPQAVEGGARLGEESAAVERDRESVVASRRADHPAGKAVAASARIPSRSGSV